MGGGGKRELFGFVPLMNSAPGADFARPDSRGLDGMGANCSNILAGTVAFTYPAGELDCMGDSD